MTRVKYQVVTEGQGAGALESTKTFALVGDRTVKAFIDPNNFEFAIIDVNNVFSTNTPVIASGSGKHLTAAKRLVRKALLKLGVSLGKEQRSSVKKTLAQATTLTTLTEPSVSSEVV